MLKSLFNKVAGFQTCNLIKKRLQRRRFPVDIAKISKSTYFEKHLRTATSEYCVFYCCINNLTLMIDFPQLTFIYSNSAIQTQKGVEYVQSYRQKHQKDISDVVLVFLLLTFIPFPSVSIADFEQVNFS